MINCPNCKSLVKELVACDVCSKIGCVRCVLRVNKKWTCEKCKSGRIEKSDLWSMFG